MLKWLRDNVFNYKMKTYQICFLYRNTQKLYLKIDSTTPAKAVKEAKEYINEFSADKNDYKFEGVDEV